MKSALLYSIIGILTSLWAIMAVFVFVAVKKTYAENGTFTNKLLIWWFAMWGVFFSALALSALYGVWLLSIDKIFALIVGSVLFIIGIVLLAVGMIEFKTLRRSCAQDTSKLITSGIYRWSRNPQFIGCLLFFTGISLAGRSILAFILIFIASIVIYWYTVRLAEPYLERLYGEEYGQYKKRTARWFSLPFKNN